MAQLRSLATVSGFTAISRVLGFVRDVLIARFVGANVVTDAFFTAFRFPNMFRRIFGEGAFNAAFVPLFAKKLEAGGKREALKFGSHTFSMLALVLGVATLIAIPCMGWIMALVAPGFKARLDTGWVSPGQAQVSPAEGRVSLGGARSVYLVYQGRGEQDPEFRLSKAEVIGAEGQRASLWDYRRSDSPGTLAAPAGGGTGFELRGVVEFPLPKKHGFKVVEIEGAAAPTTEDESVRFQVYLNDPGTFPLTVTLGRVTFVYLLCMALSAHLSGVLNTVRIFGMPAAVPILLNMSFIIGLVVFVPMLGYAGHVLAWCVFVAGFLQLGALWWTCHRQGHGIGLLWPRMSPELKRLFLLMGPGIVAAGIQQINLLVGGIIASFQQNAVSYLYYSERVYQLPLGMVGIAFGVVLLPDISRSVRARREGEARESLNRGMEYSLLITVPAAIAMVVIAYPIISGVFEWGENFTADESRMTAPTLGAFAIGLPGYVLVKVLQPGYFARGNTKTPMYIAGITVLTNIVGTLILFLLLRRQGMGHIGIALATSISAWVNVILLAVGLRRRGHLQLDRRLVDRLWRIGICSTLMGVLLLMLHSAMGSFLRSGRWECLLSLAVLVVVGLGSYLASAFTLGATTRAELREGFRGGRENWRR